VYETKADILKIIRLVFVQQIMWQLTKIVGSLDLVGNPISLISSLGTGVQDFFYEPSQGLVQSPMAFGRGVAKGTLSLMSHTTSGALSAVGKITKTVGHAIAMSTDNTFSETRKQRHAKDHGIRRPIMDLW